MMATKKKKSDRRLTGWQIFWHLLARMAAALVTIAMLFAALMIVIHRDSLTLDPIRRWVAYGSLSKTEDGKTEEYTFAGDDSNSYAAVGGGLLVCSKSALQFYADNGEMVVNKASSMRNPAICVKGDNAVAFDVGGTELYQFAGSELVYEVKAAEGEKLLSAKVNRSGYLGVVKQVAGHEATITVYDDRHAPKIDINENGNYVTDVALSDNNHYVAAIQIYQNGSDFATNLVIYRLSDAHVYSTCKLEDQLVLDMRWDNDRIWLQTESGVTVCDSEGSIIGSWYDNSKFLEAYTLDSGSYAVELLSRYKSGSAGDLRVIDSDGQQSYSRRINEEVLSMSASGNYIALLTTSNLTIYQQDLQLYATVANTNARRVVMREDGSVLMIGSETARLFLP